jgi:hypothetical protein
MARYPRFQKYGIQEAHAISNVIGRIYLLPNKISIFLCYQPSFCIVYPQSCAVIA